VDDAMKTTIDEALKAAGIAVTASELDKDFLRFQFADTDTQLKARDVVQSKVGPGYVVALNLVPNTPHWMQALGAKRVMPLPVSAPFHCALMKPAEERLAPEMRALRIHDPRVPVVANVDASPKRDGASAIDALIRQVSEAVRWEQSVRRLASEGVTAYVEVGPGNVLSGLIRKIHRGASVAAVGSPEDLEEAKPILC